MPIPSQETEEWRYTDLSDLDLSFRPHVPGHGAGVPAVGGDRAGVQVQHNSSVAMTTSNQDLDARGVVFCDLDEAVAKHEDLVPRTCTGWCPPTARSSRRCTARSGPAGRSSTCRPACTVELPLQTLTYLDEENGASSRTRCSSPARTRTSPSSTGSPGRTSSGACRTPSPRSSSGGGPRSLHVDPGVGRRRHAPGRAARRGQPGRRLPLPRDRLRRLARARGGRGAAGGAGASSEMLGIYFADGDQHFDHRSEQDHAAVNCTSDLLYKGALRDRSRGVYSGWVHVRPGAQKTNAMQTNRNIILRATRRSPGRSRTSRSRPTTSVRPCGERGPGRGGAALLPA